MDAWFGDWLRHVLFVTALALGAAASAFAAVKDETCWDRTFRVVDAARRAADLQWQQLADCLGLDQSQLMLQLHHTGNAGLYFALQRVFLPDVPPAFRAAFVCELARELHVQTIPPELLATVRAAIRECLPSPEKERA